ncbi:guanylate kinase [Galactobacillus timonensis]|uniref:guanylate kinase n=1 Tax=Galactobacillus timonensis TaxID=2041840 RepID=UPI00240905CD|nr:guanylate kinase [Galactobacillus timonensis]MDD6680954.1 guanylate kinase [Galactobacillus timonensis]
MTKKGLLIVISGPSGVGKGSVISRFINDPDLKLSYSVSMTTRSPRVGEKDGVNYYFVTRDQFMQAVKEGKMLEWTEFVGNCYGTPLEGVEKLRNEGRNVLLEIEVNGCKQVKEKCPDALTIFIVPPSTRELEDRIRKRGSEPEEIVQQRLAKAAKELEMTDQYRYVVCNDDIDLAADIIRTIIRHHMEKTF